MGPYLQYKEFSIQAFAACKRAQPDKGLDIVRNIGHSDISGPQGSAFGVLCLLHVAQQ